MYLKLFLFVFLNFIPFFIYSQEVKGIETQEITVKKSYIPKISNAKKIKTKIKTFDSLTSKIEEPKIFELPNLGAKKPDCLFTVGPG